MLRVTVAASAGAAGLAIWASSALGFSSNRATLYEQGAWRTGYSIVETDLDESRCWSVAKGEQTALLIGISAANKTVVDAWYDGWQRFGDREQVVYRIVIDDKDSWTIRATLDRLSAAEWFSSPAETRQLRKALAAGREVVLMTSDGHVIDRISLSGSSGAMAALEQCAASYLPHAWGNEVDAAATRIGFTASEVAVDPGFVDEIEGDESEHGALMISDNIVSELRGRYPDQDLTVSRLEVIPPVPSEIGSIGLAFVSYDGLRDEEGNLVNNSFTDIVAYKWEDGRFQSLGMIDNVWGIEPRQWRRAAALLEFTTTTQDDDDPRCCWTGWTRFRVNLSTLSAEIIGFSE